MMYWNASIERLVREKNVNVWSKIHKKSVICFLKKSHVKNKSFENNNKQRF